MAHMEIRPIRNEAGYDAALKEIERYFEREPERSTPEADRFDLLALVIEDYEDRHWPIETPDPVEAIKFRMEQKGFERADLAKLIGSRSRASEILNRRRRLTIDLIWKLSRKWGIPAESLIKPYKLKTKAASGRRRP
ncbi:MAG: helix-turn-helix domain-containing protein [Stellaceae bacterium]